MKVAIIFDPDPSLGFDPLDTAQMPRKLGDFIDGSKTDVLMIWREYGDQFADGLRTHVVGSGIWENVTIDQMADAIAYVTELPEDD